jgi:hypothetical protein
MLKLNDEEANAEDSRWEHVGIPKDVKRAK